MAKYVVTGGLGLVGANYTAHRLRSGDDVVVMDTNRRGKSNTFNANWLRTLPDARGSLTILDGEDGDIRDPNAVVYACEGKTDVVVHCAAQSSVNLSMQDPATDFDINARGTVNILEVLRKEHPQAQFIFMASNKVYDVTNWPTQHSGLRHKWVARHVGPSENMPFYTDAREPYGASKIAGFYYTRCYAAMYGMKAVVMVPSGMYGPGQYGRAAQGWLGWVVIATMLGLPITIAGDGYQVRDMLHVNDVNRALDVVVAGNYQGEVFNMGGGPRNAVSLIEAIRLVEKTFGQTAKLVYEDWRPQDNKVYVSNCEKLISLGWSPLVYIESGIVEMCAWAQKNRETIETLYLPK